MGIPNTGDVPSWSLGDRLRKARDHARLSQSELAARVGISRASVTNYETSRTAPNRPVLLSWAITCGVSLDWLAGSPHPGLTNVSDDIEVRKPGICTAPKAPALAAA